MQITRRQIIDYLQTNRIATSIELSRALLVTAANIRHHIQLLEKTEEPGPRFWSLDEAAPIIGIKRDTLRKKCKAQEVPHIRLGKAIFFDPKSFMSWVHSKRVKVRKMWR